MCPGSGPGVGQPQAQVFQDILLAHGPMADPCPVYRPRKPHLTPFYQCVQDHYESLEMLSGPSASRSAAPSGGRT
jgi:hypothetical protein